MIFNRTIEDVQKAKKIIEEKVKKFQALSATEQDVLDRALLNVKALNRIESKQISLKQELQDMGYYAHTANSSWTEDVWFNTADWLRLIDNTFALRDAFFVYSTTPMVVLPKYSFLYVNNLEKILYDLQTMIDFTKSIYRESDTFEAGEEI